MTRQTETLSRDDFFACCPAELLDELREQLEAWDGGDTCQRVEVTTDSLGRIDGESSPRPADIVDRAYAWARDNQGFVGSLEDWRNLPASIRAEYEAGAAGIPTG